MANELDNALDWETQWFMFQGGPEGARTVLSAVSTSMMTFTGVVFSVTILVLQLASTQFSPRVLRAFLRDRGSQLSLGVFVGTFVYALLALRNVREGTEEVDRFVPALSVWLAVVLAVASVATFIYYIHHVAQSIRAVSIIKVIAHEARHQLKKMYPEGVGQDASDPEPRWPDGEPTLVIPHLGVSGVIAAVDESHLWKCVTKSTAVVAMHRMVGDFVPYGSPLFEIWGDPEGLDAKELLATVTITSERSIRQDSAFGIRQLVDIAERALSPGTNDPTTAVQAIDAIHDLLRRIARRKFPNPWRLDERGFLRLVLPRPDFDAYVVLAFDEIRQFGAGQMQVMRRLRFALEDLLRVAPKFRQQALLRQLHLLDKTISREFDDVEDATMAQLPAPQGHGPH